MVFLGSKAVGSDKEVLSAVAKEDIMASNFLAIDATTGLFKKVSAATDKIVGFAIAPGQGVGGNKTDDLVVQTSTNKNYLKFLTKAGQGVPYITRANGYYVELGGNVSVNDPIYLNPTDGLVCKDASSTLEGSTVNHIRIGNGYFTQAGVKGDIITISFDLL